MHTGGKVCEGTDEKHQFSELQLSYQGCIQGGLVVTAGV